MSPIRSRPWAPAALAITVVLLASACSSAGASLAPSAAAPSVAPSGSAPLATTAPSASLAASPSVAAVTFPLTLTDDEGTSVTLPAEPKKIVSLTPANTEIVYALGAGDRVVATDDASDYPAEAAPLPDVATFKGVDVEKVVGLGADLVLAAGLGGTSPEAIAKLRDLKVPVLVVYAPSIDGVYHDIDLIGDAVGEPAAADAVIDGMRTDMDAVHAAATAAGTAPRVYYEVGYDSMTGQIFAPAKDSFVADMVTQAGGETITTKDASTYEIALEDLINADPQLIVLGVNQYYNPTPAEVKARAGWDVMTAVKDDAVKIVEDTEITRPGPRLPTGLRNLAHVIQPTATWPSAPAAP